MYKVAKNIILLLCCSAQLYAQNYVATDSTCDAATIWETFVINNQGRSVKLAYTNSFLTLFVFLSPECPLCKNYTLTLNQLQNEHKEELKIYGIVPGKAYTLKTVNEFKKDYKVVFPLFIDRQKKLTGCLKATVTPEVVLINKEDKVIYRGAIDDWVTELGKQKLKVANEYLRQAVLQYKSQQPITTKYVAPKGCLINEY
jgi:thiol-disulfide isomerase/thioredoxin